MARILVTGGTGMIGRRLLPELAATGHNVRALSRNAASAPEIAGVEWFKTSGVDTMTIEDWAEALDGIDAVAHLAARTQAVDSEEDAEAFLAVNTRPTMRLAKAMASDNTSRRLVFVSSTHACRETSKEVLTSDILPAPQSAYGRSKAEAETAVRSALGQGAVDYVILRPCAVYGPGHTGNLAKLIGLLRKGLPLPIGATQNRRSIVYVGNVTHAVKRALIEPAVSRQTFFVADAAPLSSVELTQLLGVTTGWTPRIFSLPLWVLRLLGRVGDGVKALTGRNIGINSLAVSKISESLVVDAETLWSAIGPPPYTTEQGFADLFHAKKTA